MGERDRERGETETGRDGGREREGGREGYGEKDEEGETGTDRQRKKWRVRERETEEIRIVVSRMTQIKCQVNLDFNSSLICPEYC